MAWVASFALGEIFISRRRGAERAITYGLCAKVPVLIFSSRTESAPTELRVKSAGLEVLHNVL